MNSNFSQEEAKTLIEGITGLFCDVLEFVDDVRFQRVNRDILESKNARDIAYRLGRTEERYGKEIFIFDSLMGIAVKIRNRKNPITAPLMQVTYRQEYMVCQNCFKSVTVSIPVHGYFWQPSLPPSPIICHDCHRLTELTALILLFSAFKKIWEKGVEQVEEKCIDWLAKQFGNDADEIRREYYAERNR